jgi:hypothetical protein
MQTTFLAICGLLPLYSNYNTKMLTGMSRASERQARTSEVMCPALTRHYIHQANKS